MIVGVSLDPCLMAQNVPGSCFPRGVVDTSEMAAYVAREDGTIARLSLQDGKPGWISSRASLPLIVISGRLLAADYPKAKEGQFSVAIIATRDGSLLARSESVSLDLPAFSPAETPPVLEAIPMHESVRMQWVTTARNRGGASPPIQQAARAPRRTRHSVIVDPLTARLTEQSAEQLSSPDAASTPSRESVPYVRGDKWSSGPWHAGETTADLIRMSSGGNRTLSLQIRGTSDQQADKTVPLGLNDNPSAPRVTQDGAYVLLSDNDGTAQTYRIFSSTSGAEIGRATLPPGAHEICIHGSQLYFLAAGFSGNRSDIVIRALDIAANRVLWEYSLGERRTGTPPPLPQ